MKELDELDLGVDAGDPIEVFCYTVSDMNRAALLVAYARIDRDTIHDLNRGPALRVDGIMVSVRLTTPRNH
jgi:hypothetical protein